MKQVLQNVLDLEQACCQEVSNVTEFNELVLKLQGAKIEETEPIANGYGDQSIRGMNIYLMLSNGEQIALEIYPGEDEPDKLGVNVYTAPKE